MQSGCKTFHSIVPLDSFKLVGMASQEAPFLNYYSKSSKHLSPKAKPLENAFTAKHTILQNQHDKVKRTVS